MVRKANRGWCELETIVNVRKSLLSCHAEQSRRDRLMNVTTFQVAV